MSTTPPVLLACGLALLLAMAGARADVDAAPPAAHERQDIQSRFNRERQACAQRFTVNDCVDAARSRERSALADLQRRQQAAATQQRAQRAGEHQREVQARQVADATPAAPATASAATAARAFTAPAAPVIRPRVAPAAADRAQSAASQAARRAAAARQLQQTIKADQARIDGRLARRAAQGKTVPPLPPGPAASLPRR
ncbi:MAG: hypothetical protein IPI03_19685 [Rubrivivax sp.]|nr:hypothetical protein [Rubrivivax sp.]MBK7263947.1 hypothetical protein [Rubrivivax sp.]MBK8526616.1 hypothetical protein [Rubrivivax sp.]